MYKRIIKAEPLDGHLIHLTFEGGELRVFDCKPYLNLAVFSPLKDKMYFLKLKISFGTIEWSDGVAFDPEFLYQESLPITSSSEKRSCKLQ